MKLCSCTNCQFSSKISFCRNIIRYLRCKRINQKNSRYKNTFRTWQKVSSVWKSYLHGCRNPLCIVWLQPNNAFIKSTDHLRMLHLNKIKLRLGINQYKCGSQQSMFTLPPQNLDDIGMMDLRSEQPYKEGGRTSSSDCQ